MTYGIKPGGTRFNMVPNLSPKGIMIKSLGKIISYKMIFRIKRETRPNMVQDLSPKETITKSMRERKRAYKE